MNKENEAIKFGTRLSILYIILGVIGFVLIILPMVFYSNDKLESIGIIGDTVGGILSPIFAVPATILTFLAFWVQFKANQEVQYQFKIQQFESQLYEMIRLYRNNVEEISIGKISGRKCFARMLDEFKFIYYETEYYFRDKELEEILLNEISYYIFYFGVGNNIKEILYAKYQNININDNIDNLITRLEKYKGEHIMENKIIFYDDRNILREYNFHYIPFKGHISRLGHYFRHLFQTVSYIVDCEIIDEKTKYKYIKLLRAQLSNYELILLYFNGITDMGIDWVERGYFTDYKFLKNLPYQLINYSVNPLEYLGELNNNGEKIFD
ncbi:Putative phage abortive infection protein [Flavobacterium aquidurense]|nr:putative phage abortive infection protein [Flavobacterium frigidimaris]SDZ58159.1 Putative phage abortive infection protein [Flavobacterium aquidurense]